MRRLLLALLLCPLCACDGDTGAPGESRGTATVVLDYGGVVHTITRDVTVTVGDPIHVGSVAETNAVHLTIGSSGAGTTAEEGDFLLLSSGEFQVDLGPTPALLQFWSLAVDGASVTGSLTDTHTAEAMAANQVWAVDTIGGDPLTTYVYPYLMGTGTTLSGTLGGGAQLVIQGRGVAVDGLSEVQFRIEVATTR